jgi:hypothetical protein
VAKPLGSVSPHQDQKYSNENISLPWDWSSRNLGAVLHIGVSSIATWIFLVGGAGPNNENKSAECTIDA